MAFFDLTNNPDNRTFAPGEVVGFEVRALDGNDTVVGSSSDEDINGNRGNDSIGGGSGNDTLRGGKESDFVLGGDGADLVNGNNGNDFVYGEAGDDVARGGQDNDFVSGGAGSDFLYGDFGTDTLEGGTGDDVFVLRTATAVSNSLLADVIIDFNSIAGDFDRIGLTDGVTESGISLVPGGGSLGYTAADTFIRLGTSGDFLGVVLGASVGVLTGRFTTAVN